MIDGLDSIECDGKWENTRGHGAVLLDVRGNHIDFWMEENG